ncbi:MAG TPA: pectinesterase family protein [Bacteroidota bacterium]|nr:pectinesterase family protein [Bacteroidota bacterium]
MRRISLTIVFLIGCSAGAAARERADIIVAQDGSGQFRSIQEALNSIPGHNTRTVTILIKNGVYHEKLFVQKSNVALVGEDRDSTRIVFAELRQNWRAAHGDSDWGSAVINIDSTVTDLTIANLTVYNNYGTLYGSHEHQFTIWGSGTRIIIIDCNILGDGGDTLSLWNRSDGMYYHANCFFEGWVDFVCPRGWCYITDSRFFGHNLSASIWHDGSANKDEKFVIRYSQFDGVLGFPLGRHHRDAQFYLLNCIFSRTMADRQIYGPKESPNLVPWQWGARYYYYNCHREGGDFDWFKDNLFSAEGAPAPGDITAAWTFMEKWNPEMDMPHVLPFVALPFPRNAAYGVNGKHVVLRWIPSRNAGSENVYFGKEGSIELIQNHATNSIELHNLDPESRYDWRVDEISGIDTTRGPVWHFTTE